MVKRVGKYEIGKTLGEGTFGKVKYAVNTETYERVAIKVLDKEKIQKQNMGAQIKKEISIMKMVRNDHVVKLKEVLASRTKIFIVLELVTGGELFDKIVAEGRFKDDQARLYFQQLIDGVVYCHNAGVCHRDLKPENLLLDDNENLKISDFGLSALYNGPADTEASRSTLLHTTCGTPNYVAPEVLADKGYDGRAADVWSCGVILYVLLAGFLPFDEPTMSALFRKIQKAEFSYPSWFSADVKALLDKILVADPAQRVGLVEIMKDPWFTPGYTPGAYMAPGVAAAGGASSGGAATPSAEQVEGAIQEGADYSADAADAAGSKSGPKLMNAFDLINMCGGMALNRMFMQEAEKKVKRYNQFTSTMAPADILKHISDALTSLKAGNPDRLMADAAATDPPIVNSETYKITAGQRTSKGLITIKAQVYVMAPNLHLIEMRRGRGDITEYSRFINELTAKLQGVPNLLNQPAGGGGGGAQ